LNPYYLTCHLLLCKVIAYGREALQPANGNPPEQAVSVPRPGGDPGPVPHLGALGAPLGPTGRASWHFPAAVQRAAHLARRGPTRDTHARHRRPHDPEDSRNHAPARQTDRQTLGTARALL